MPCKEVRERYIAQHRCASCGAYLDEDYTNKTCKSCIDKAHVRTLADYKFYQSIGICPKCRKEKLFGDEKNCLECRNKDASIREKYRKNNAESYREKMRIYYKKWTTAKREQGLCTRCGTRKSVYGYKTCPICRSKNADFRASKF